MARNFRQVRHAFAGGLAWMGHRSGLRSCEVPSQQVRMMQWPLASEMLLKVVAWRKRR